MNTPHHMARMDKPLKVDVLTVSPGALNQPPAVIHWHTLVHPLEADASTTDWDLVTCWRCLDLGPIEAVPHG